MEEEKGIGFMPLEFRGLALIDPPKWRGRFSGYAVPNRPGQITICEVSVEALLALAGEQTLSEGDLMGVFELHKEAILSAASKQLDSGNIRPIVEAKDLLCRSSV